MRLSRAIVALALVASLVLPGCFLCTIRPQVKAASQALDGIKVKFDTAYPALQLVLKEAAGVGLPGIEGYEALAMAAKAQFDRLYFDVLCPDETTVSEAVEVINRVQGATKSVAMGLVKYRRE